MSTGGGAYPPARVPTLTEVIELSETQTSSPAQDDDEDFGIIEPVPDDREESSDPGQTGVVSLPAFPPVSEEQLVQRVMAELQRQIDLMLEYRLREALAPLLARAADGLVRDMRSELASTLRDVVARAVAQEVARHRTR